METKICSKCGREYHLIVLNLEEINVEIAETLGEKSCVMLIQKNIEKNLRKGRKIKRTGFI